MFDMSNKRLKKKSLALGIFIFGVFMIIFSFSTAEKGLWAAWQTEEYSHGFFIPLISLLIAAHLLADNPPNISASWWGPAMLIVAALLELISRFSAFGAAEQYGLIFALLGIALTCLGSRGCMVDGPCIRVLNFCHSPAPFISG